MATSRRRPPWPIRVASHRSHRRSPGPGCHPQVRFRSTRKPQSHGGQSALPGQVGNIPLPGASDTSTRPGRIAFCRQDPGVAVTTGEVYPTLADFTALAADRRVVPVTRRLLADSETPIGVYRALAGGPGTFLLESAEAGGAWSRYSFIGVRCLTTLTERDGQAVWLGGEPPAGVPLTGDLLEVLRATVDVLA